ncbi:hypothetical protein [Paenibacillus lactis]|uniref:hypothetical protein n=1 Tax=Paenibacillus lactis TaxID=228574 RepID=UPI003D744629
MSLVNLNKRILLSRKEGGTINKMIRNEYRIDGETTVILVKKKNGEVFEVLIDTEDLKLLDELNLWVSVQYYRGTEDYYARMTKYISKANGGPRYEILMLHRVIMRADENEEVDHIEHNTLDNRKKNLRKISNDMNLKNRKGKNSNNKSGYRNVFWSSSEQKWVVSLCIKNKRFRCGSFTDVHEAGRHAEEMRKKYYGEFAGKS